jgi:hypothetical protein
VPPQRVVELPNVEVLRDGRVVLAFQRARVLILWLDAWWRRLWFEIWRGRLVKRERIRIELCGGLDSSLGAFLFFKAMAGEAASKTD